MQLFGACLPIPHFHAHRTRSILLSNQILIQCVHTMHFLPSTRSNSHRPPVFSLLHALWMLAPSSQLSSFRFKYKLISSSPSANTPFFFSLLKHLSSLFFSWHQLIVLMNLQRPCAWWMRRDTWARNSSRPSSRRDTQFTRQFKTMVRYVYIYIHHVSPYLLFVLLCSCIHEKFKIILFLSLGCLFAKRGFRTPKFFIFFL